MTYTGPVTDPDTGQAGTGTWLSWSQDNDALGRVGVEYTPDGTVLDTHPDAAPYHRSYAYDGAGRLVGVNDRTANPATGGPDSAADAQTNAGCTTRAYTFDPNGRRTSLTTRTATAGDPCATTGGTVKSWAYDSADRPTTAPTLGTTPGGAYTYDPLGRTTTLPANDTLAPAGGDATLGYYTDDAPWQITQNGITQTHDYDPAGRRGLATTRNATGTETRRLQRTYTGTTDNPTTTTETTPLGGTLTTRYISGLAGDLTATHTNQAGGGTSTQIQLADPHGDITATLDPTAATPGIDSWHDTDEYGNPRTTVSGTFTPAGGTTPAAYGWHGTKERSADTPAGITLMGARLYNPTTGHFTSTDPIVGGNDTTYNYPNDPINQLDLDGKAFWKKRSFWKGVIKYGSFAAVGACVVLTAGACVVAAGAAFAASASMRTYEFGKDRQWKQKNGTRNYIRGLVGDAVSARMPGVRFANRFRLPKHMTRGRHLARVRGYIGLGGALRTARGRRNGLGQAASAAWIASGL